MTGQLSPSLYISSLDLLDTLQASTFGQLDIPQQQAMDAAYQRLDTVQEMARDSGWQSISSHLLDAAEKSIALGLSISDAVNGCIPEWPDPLYPRIEETALLIAEKDFTRFKDITLLMDASSPLARQGAALMRSAYASDTGESVRLRESYCDYLARLHDLTLGRAPAPLATDALDLQRVSVEPVSVNADGTPAPYLAYRFKYPLGGPESSDTAALETVMVDDQNAESRDHPENAVLFQGSLSAAVARFRDLFYEGDAEKGIAQIPTSSTDEMREKLTEAVASIDRCQKDLPTEVSMNFELFKQELSAVHGPVMSSDYDAEDVGFAQPGGSSPGGPAF